MPDGPYTHKTRSSSKLHQPKNKTKKDEVLIIQK